LKDMICDQTLDRIHAQLQTQNEREIFSLMQQACEDVGKARLIEEFCVNESLRHFTITPESELNIRDEIIIHPKAYLQLPVQYRRLLVKLCEKLRNLDVSYETCKEVEMFRQVYCITFERDRAQRRNRIHEVMNMIERQQIIEQVEVGGRKIFEGIKPFEIDRLCKVFRESCKNDNRLIAFGHRFANQIRCTNITEYCAAVEYAVRRLKEKVAEQREIVRQQNLRNDEQHITTDYHTLLADENFMNSVEEQFKQLQERCNSFRPNNVPVACNLQFANSKAAANHYDKHKNDFPGRQLTLEEYCNLAVDLTSGQVDDCLEKCQLTQDGTSLRREFVSETRNAFAIVIDRPDGTSVIATLMRLSDKQVGLLRTTRKPGYR